MTSICEPGALTLISAPRPGVLNTGRLLRSQHLNSQPVIELLDVPDLDSLPEDQLTVAFQCALHVHKIRVDSDNKR
jgi:hypothetical protein